MKGKYISTSLMLAVLAGGKEGTTVLVHETPANTNDHQLIWSKTPEVSIQPIASANDAGSISLT
jgi:hypothetical protein